MFFFKGCLCFKAFIFTIILFIMSQNWSIIWKSSILNKWKWKLKNYELWRIILHLSLNQFISFQIFIMNQAYFKTWFFSLLFSSFVTAEWNPKDFLKREHSLIKPFTGKLQYLAKKATILLTINYRVFGGFCV